MSEITELNEKQRKAFSQLKRAFTACKKANILFANWYGDLTAYDGSLVHDASDKHLTDLDYMFIDYGENSRHKISIPHEWADDESSHGLILTNKGKRILKTMNDE